MSVSGIEGFLKSLNFLEEEKATFRKLLTIKEFDKDELLLEEGDVSTSVYFIVKGSVRMFYIDYCGKEHIKSFNFDGDFIAPYSSILTRSPSNHYIQCLSASQFIYFDYIEARKVLGDPVSWLKLELSLVQNEYMEKEKREYEFLILPARERYANFITQYKEYIHLIPEKYMASYLGINPSTLSRLKHSLG